MAAEGALAEGADTDGAGVSAPGVCSLRDGDRQATTRRLTMNARVTGDRCFTPVTLRCPREEVRALCVGSGGRRGGDGVVGDDCGRDGAIVNPRIRSTSVLGWPRACRCPPGDRSDAAPDRCQQRRSVFGSPGSVRAAWLLLRFRARCQRRLAAASRAVDDRILRAVVRAKEPRGHVGRRRGMAWMVPPGRRAHVGGAGSERGHLFRRRAWAR